MKNHFSTSMHIIVITIGLYKFHTTSQTVTLSYAVIVSFTIRVVCKPALTDSPVENGEVRSTVKFGDLCNELISHVYVASNACDLIRPFRH